MIFGFGWSPEKREGLVGALPYYFLYLQEWPLLLGVHGRFENIPFTQTWSLGVEEKFYVVWALLGFVAWRNARALRLWGTVALTAALIVSSTVVKNRLSLFLYPHSHILIGCVIALLLDDPTWFGRLAWLCRSLPGWLILGVLLVLHLTMPSLTSRGRGSSRAPMPSPRRCSSRWSSWGKARSRVCSAGRAWSRSASCLTGCTSSSCSPAAGRRALHGRPRGNSGLDFGPAPGLVLVGGLGPALGRDDRVARHQDRTTPLGHHPQGIDSGTLYLIFVDDDEWVEPAWLLSFVRLAAAGRADVLRGPVYPEFDEGIPPWIITSKLFDSPVIRLAWLCKFDGPFDPWFDLMGGEDTHFFERTHRLGLLRLVSPRRSPTSGSR